MSHTAHRTNHTPLIVVGLAMALGPLAALSVGSRYADEETFARAQAGADNIRLRQMEEIIASPMQPAGDTQAYVGAMPEGSSSGS